MVKIFLIFCSNFSEAAGFNFHVQIVALLLAKGANCELKNKTGITARLDARKGKIHCSCSED